MSTEHRKHAFLVLLHNQVCRHFRAPMAWHRDNPVCTKISEQIQSSVQLFRLELFCALNGQSISGSTLLNLIGQADLRICRAVVVRSDLASSHHFVGCFD